MFERLYASRTVPGRAVGTGIGLAIVRELAGAMGGDAHVEPIGSVGTRFVVTLADVRRGTRTRRWAAIRSAQRRIATHQR